MFHTRDDTLRFASIRAPALLFALFHACYHGKCRYCAEISTANVNYTVQFSSLSAEKTARPSEKFASRDADIKSENNAETKLLCTKIMSATRDKWVTTTKNHELITC